MDENLNWKSFWEDYRKGEAVKETDLFFQVGKTINKVPVPEKDFTLMVENVVEALNLNKADILIDICCGNGLLTYPLSKFSKQVYAFDFTEQMIANAKKFKQSENIIYAVGDASKDFFNLFQMEVLPNKFLMNDSLGYFSKDDLHQILTYIKRMVSRFSFYITGVPCEELKWNFYDTEERKEAYYSNNKSGDNYNGGMGKWWSYLELENVASNLGVKCTIDKQSSVSNYRLNVMFEKNS